MNSKLDIYGVPVLDEFISDDFSENKKLYKSINIDYKSDFNSDGNEDIKQHARYYNYLLAVETFVHAVEIDNLKSKLINKNVNEDKYTSSDFSKYKNLLYYFNRYIRSNIKYSERVKLYIESIKELKIIDVSISETEAKTIHEKIKRDKHFNAKITNEQFNALVDLIREKLKSQDYLTKLAARKYNPTRRKDSLNAFLDELFAKHSRLLVCRMDIYIKSEFKDQMTVDDMHKLRERLLNNMRSNSFFDDFVGFIWKLEAGDRRGIHFHFFFFLLGSTHKCDKYITHKICKYVEKISQNKLYGYNCNAKRNYFKRIGIGMINHFDEELRGNLEYAVGYLTKSDQLLRVNDNNRRVIGKGFICRKPKSNAGRPRTRSAE